MPITNATSVRTIAKKHLTFYPNKVAVSNTDSSQTNTDSSEFVELASGVTVYQGAALAVGSDGKYRLASITATSNLSACCFALEAGEGGMWIRVEKKRKIIVAGSSFIAGEQVYLTNGTPNIGASVDDTIGKIVQMLGIAVSATSFEPRISAPFEVVS